MITPQSVDRAAQVARWRDSIGTVPRPRARAESPFLIGVLRGEGIGPELLHESFGLSGPALRIQEAVCEVWREGWRTEDLAQDGCRIAGTRQTGRLVSEAILSCRQCPA